MLHGFRNSPGIWFHSALAGFPALGPPEDPEGQGSLAPDMKPSTPCCWISFHPRICSRTYPCDSDAPGRWNTRVSGSNPDHSPQLATSSFPRDCIALIWPFPVLIEPPGPTKDSPKADLANRIKRDRKPTQSYKCRQALPPQFPLPPLLPCHCPSPIIPISTRTMPGLS
ncbi:hypothetical protein BCR34DRAFT_101022 [Clohesyomyces aquaticus]|uniref:Uncharacterized protein n=1 Tax=Clohesyomyces aquaticus TaxID=1231657 RepID=A0A1Y1YSP5_9PLEO|nr:hypothetical protein BCR34DRAFT_101022 [Clohesyomyces aquaticus]